MKRLLRTLGIAAVSILLFMLTACGIPKWQEQLDLGMKCLAEGEEREAIAAFTAVIESDPKNIAAYMGRAQACAAQNAYEQALSDYNIVMTMDEIGEAVLAEAYMGRAGVYESLGRSGGALADYSAVIDFLRQEKKPTAESAARLQECLLKRAALYMMQESYEEAAADYSEALGLLPQEKTPTTESTAMLQESLMKCAALYAVQGNYEEAEANYSTVIDALMQETTPTEASTAMLRECLTKRAALYAMRGSYEEAAADYSIVLERLLPENAETAPEPEVEAAVGRAELYSMLAQYEKAERDYTRALDALRRCSENAAEDGSALAEQQRRAYLGRAEANVMLARCTEAVQDYDSAIALGAEEEEARDQLLEQVSLWKSRCADLGAAKAWLAETGHEDAVENLNDVVDLLRTLEKRAAENGVKSYDAVRAAVTNADAQNRMRALLAAGYQLRLFDAESGRMTALYTADGAWSDVREAAPAAPELSALTEKIAAKTLAGRAEAERGGAPAEKPPQEVSQKQLFLYSGGHAGRSREGMGLWMIFNGGERDLNAESYTWENDAPRGGFKQPEEPEPPEWKTLRFTKSAQGSNVERIITTTVTYAVGQPTIGVKEVWDETWMAEGRYISDQLDGTHFDIKQAVERTETHTVELSLTLSEPLLGIGGQSDQSCVFLVPNGTTVTGRTASQEEAVIENYQSSVSAAVRRGAEDAVITFNEKDEFGTMKFYFRAQ